VPQKKLDFFLEEKGGEEAANNAGVANAEKLAKNVAVYHQ
jgi:hypothetical protein